jgi:hypothetical protein
MVSRGLLSGPACDSGWDTEREEQPAEAPAAAPRAEVAWDLPHDSLSAWLSVGTESARAAEWASSSIPALRRACGRMLSGLRVGRPQENPGS